MLAGFGWDALNIVVFSFVFLAAALLTWLAASGRCANGHV